MAKLLLFFFIIIILIPSVKFQQKDEDGKQTKTKQLNEKFYPSESHYSI